MKAFQLALVSKFNQRCIKGVLTYQGYQVLIGATSLKLKRVAMNVRTIIHKSVRSPKCCLQRYFLNQYRFRTSVHPGMSFFETVARPSDWLASMFFKLMDLLNGVIEDNERFTLTFKTFSNVLSSNIRY